MSNEVTLPTFDLVIRKVDVMNVVSGPNLIKGKDHMVRVWPGFDSNLIDELNLLTLPYAEQSYIKNGQTIKELQQAFPIIVDNYPPLAELKQDPEKEIMPGVKARKLMMDIKEGIDSSNIYRWNKPNPDTPTITFKGFIENWNVKEDNEFNNFGQAAIIKQLNEQHKEYKFVLFVIGKDPKISRTTNNLITAGMRQNYDYLVEVTPFVKDMTKVDYELRPIQINYNKSRMAGYRAKGIFLPFEDQIYVNRIMHNITTRMEETRKKLKADFSVGFILDDELMGSRRTIAFTTRKARWLYYKYDLAMLHPATLAHELGHAIADLDEDYHDVTILGINLVSYFGKAIEDPGFSIFEGGFIGMPRINIWTELPESGYHDGTRDWPDNSTDIQFKYQNIMGPRYYNVMSMGGTAGRWINAATYNAFLTELKRQGYFR